MSDPTRALNEMREHFKDLDPEKYRETAMKGSPRLLESVQQSDDELEGLGLKDLPSSTSSIPSSDSNTMGNLARIPLSAYLACALTGLTSKDRQLVFHVSDSISRICKDLEIDLYEPRKKTDPVHHSDVEDSTVYQLDKERVAGSDLLVYLALHPSTGSGEELIIAHEAMVPIIVVSHHETTISRMVTGIPGLILKVQYDDPTDLHDELRATLLKVRPQLVRRKIAFADHDVNIVGDRIRKLRESQGISRDQLVEVTAARAGINKTKLAHLEESKDRDSNPSLVVLREIALALKTTVADLVEPDLDDILLGKLSSWVDDRHAARFGLVSIKDRNRVLRRLLLRLVDSLETDEH